MSIIISKKVLIRQKFEGELTITMLDKFKEYEKDLDFYSRYSGNSEFNRLCGDFNSFLDLINEIYSI